MNIVKQKWEFLNSLNPLVPEQLSKLFSFGLQTLAFRNIQSLRANARIAHLNWPAAKMKVYRLTQNARVPQIFTATLKLINLVNEEDIVAVDFSDFNGFQVLMFAKQTRKGRAIPLYFEILQYPIEKGSQNLFIIRAIKNFAKLIGFKPKLVFDRGFACPAIVRFLAKNQYVFYLRVKKRKSVTLEGQKVLALNLPDNDNLVLAYDQEQRLIISDPQDNLKEPWYLLTNDWESRRDQVINIYYHRFEIEEFFRDAKRLLGLEYLKLKTELSLAVVLWFTLLISWFFCGLEEQMSELDKKAREQMRLSNFRYLFESLQQEIIYLAEGQFMLRTGG